MSSYKLREVDATTCGKQLKQSNKNNSWIGQLLVFFLGVVPVGLTFIFFEDKGSPLLFIGPIVLMALMVILGNGMRKLYDYFIEMREK